MRILLVTHAPLQPEFGAAQAAIHLAAALCARGHDALAWSTEPLPAAAAARSWSTWWWQRRRIEDYLAASPPFDLLDLPAVSISRRIAAHPRVVARSVQPDLLYFGAAIAAQLRRPRWSSLRFAVHLPTLGLVSGAILQGWRRAGLLLCLGTHETDWMRRRFPWTREKLETYVDAIAPEDQEIFAGIRRQRRERVPQAGPRPLRFLWIGRWVPQKGTALLLRFLAERARSHPEDTFTLAGCGPQAERECPPELVRSGRLRLVPSFPRSALPRLLEEHDAGLFTSAVEGWGLSLNEMLESGLPVFATRAGGMADLAPYFPTTLRPFPPPADVDLPGLPGPAEDLTANGYFARFTWASVAREYEERVIARLP